MVQFIDNQLKTVPAAGDVVPIRDISSNTDKRTTINGVASAVAEINAAAYGVMRFAAFATGFAGSGSNALPYDLLESPSKNVTFLTGGVIRLDVAGFYLVTANVMSIDAPSGTIQQVQFSTDNGTNFQDMGWTARATAEFTTRQYPVKTFQKYFPAGTQLRHLVDSNQQRFGGTTSNPAATSLAVAKLA